MKSIYLRNVAATAAIVALSVVILMLAILGMGRFHLISGYKESMLASAQDAVNMASAIAEFENLESWTLNLAVDLISDNTSNDVYICDGNGAVICCSDQPRAYRRTLAPVTAHYLETIDRNGNLMETTTLDGFFPEKRFVVGLPIVLSTEKTIGYLFEVRDIEEIVSDWNEFTNIMVVVTLTIFAITIVVSIVYSKRMAKPLDEMAEASRRFARGDFSVRVKQVEDTADEMGMLIDSFNKMADSLSAAEVHRSEFIANISHELRTPMTTIAGFADGILDGTIPREEQDKYLISIRDETRRLSRLVREMLDVSQTSARSKDPVQRTVFDLTELVLQTMLSFESRATQKHLDVDPQLPDNSIMVTADKDAITRVIYNLIDNAVKFAWPETCIVIKVYKENGKAYVSVRDTGETIPPDDLPFIFDRFHKSDRSRSMDKEGVGLGLYLVKAIINSHDEDIAVKSENNLTEFVFSLALAE